MIPPGKRLLNFDGSLHAVGHAGKLHQQPVAGGLDQAAAMLGDLGIDELFADGFELRKRAGFVRLHEARKADHIGSDDHCQPARKHIVGRTPPLGQTMVPQKAERCVPRIQPIDSRPAENMCFAGSYIPNDSGAITKGCRRYALAQCRLTSGHDLSRKARKLPCAGKPKPTCLHQTECRIGV